MLNRNRAAALAVLATTLIASAPAAHAAVTPVRPPVKALKCTPYTPVGKSGLTARSCASIVRVAGGTKVVQSLDVVNSRDTTATVSVGHVTQVGKTAKKAPLTVVTVQARSTAHLQDAVVVPGHGAATGHYTITARTRSGSGMVNVRAGSATIPVPVVKF